MKVYKKNLYYYTMSIHANGYWEGAEASCQHVYDASLGDSLTKFFKTENVKSLVDFGCGMGNYVNTFQQNNINAIGFDGNPNTPELTNNLGKVLDLSVPYNFKNHLIGLCLLKLVSIYQHILKIFLFRIYIITINMV
jgi:hypothetical protein